MTDEALIESITQFAAIDPDTRAGFDAVSTLTKMLAGQPEFEGLPRRVSSARGWHNFSSEFAAQRMLIIARSPRGPAASVTWLRKILAVKHASFSAVKALHGIKCSSDISVSANIVLTPFDALPQSETRDWLILQYEATSERRRAFDEIKSPPSAALCYTGTVRPLFDDPASPMSDWFNELDEAAQFNTISFTSRRNGDSGNGHCGMESWTHSLRQRDKWQLRSLQARISLERKESDDEEIPPQSFCGI